MFRLDFKVISKGQSSKWWHSMHLQRMFFYVCKLGTLMYCWYYMFCPLSSPDGSDCHQMVSSLHWMFQLLTKTSFCLWVRSDDQSTTRRILTSTDHFYSSISSRMTCLLLLFVFILKSYMLFLIFLVLPATSMLIALKMTSTGNS